MILEILLIYYRKNPILIYFYLLNCKSVCFVHSVLKDCFLNKYKNYLPRRTLFIIFTLIIDTACNAVTLVHKQLRNRINLVAIEFISLVKTNFERCNAAKWNKFYVVFLPLVTAILSTSMAVLGSSLFALSVTSYFKMTSIMFPLMMFSRGLLGAANGGCQRKTCIFADFSETRL